MPADPLSLLLAQIEADLDRLMARFADLVEQRARAGRGRDDRPLTAAAGLALALLLAREVDRRFGRDERAVVTRDGRPATPVARLLDVGLVKAARLAGVEPAAGRWRSALAGRVVAAGDETKRQVRDRVAWHVQRRTPLDVAAADIASLLRPTASSPSGPPGGTDATYRARQLLLNETRRTAGAAVVRATAASGGRYLVRWTLSGAHRDPDVCTANARRNVGFGPGVYEPRDVPAYPSHPNCRCRLVPVRVDRQ